MTLNLLVKTGYLHGLEHSMLEQGLGFKCYKHHFFPLLSYFRI